MLGCVVIGGGQAGLATSCHLSRLGIEHAVLEGGAVAETWRSARWDGFHLNTPRWATQLPGMTRPEGDPDAFASSPEVIATLERYAREIGAPVQTQVEVTALRRRDGRFELETSHGPLRARSVVVASGAYQQPTAPRVEGAPSGVAQLHTSAYRRPSDLPAGGVLVVGSGQSACEIAQELVGDGRDVQLAVGRCAWAPRRHRGRELIRWMVDVGMMDATLDSLSSPVERLAGNVTVSGARGGVDCNPLLLESAGAHLHGRLRGFDGGRAVFADDLDDSLAHSLDYERRLRSRFDDHAAAAGLDLPEHGPLEWPRRRRDGADLPLRRRGIRSVLWGNGYRPAFGWIDLPLFDDLGFPRTQRGVTEVPGLAFVGLPWLHTRKSPLLLGVGGDAEHVARAVADHLGERRQAVQPASRRHQYQHDGHVSPLGAPPAR